MEEKVRENRLRRMAARQGLRLLKSRRRDPRAIDYRKFTLLEPIQNAHILGMVPLDYIEQYLMRPRD